MGIDWKNGQRRNTSTSLQDYVDDCLGILGTSSSEHGKYSWGIYYVNSWSMVIIKIDSMFRNLKSSIMIRSSYNLKKEFSSCIEKRSQINS